MFKIVYGDITDFETDAVVNAANNRLKAGSGVCGAIFRRADSEELQKECDRIGFCETGEAVITGAYNLKAEYIIHTVGPVYRDGSHGEEELLRKCYRNSMELLCERGLKSIAFPLISSGVYGYPYDEALETAKSEIENFIRTHDIDVYLVLFK